MLELDPSLQERQTHEGGSPDQDSFFGPTEATSNGFVPGEWARADTGLAGPGLDTGRGFELSDLALDGVEQELAGLGGEDKGAALAKLDALGKKKHAEVEKGMEVQEAEVQHEAVHQQDGPVGDAPETAPIAVSPTAKKRVAPPPTVKMAPDRTGMRAQIEAAGDKELGQIDAAFERQIADLDKRFAGQLAGLDSTIETETGGIDATTNRVDQKLVGDIGDRSAKHQAQIKIGTTAHQKAATEQRALVDQQAEVEQSDTGQAASDQAAHLAAQAKLRADQTRATGKREAATARKAGSDKAAQAIAAANARAAQVPEGERAAIIADGKRRADQARAEGENQAKAIESRAESTAAQLDKDGTKTSTAHGGARKEKAAANLESTRRTQGQRITTQADIANAEMQQHAANAHGRMEAERATFQSDADGKKGGATDEMARQREAAQKKAADLKADTIEKMTATHAKERAKVEAKIAKLLGDLDKAKDKDLARVGKQLGRDLQALDQSDQATELALKKQVKRADKTLASDVNARKKKVRAAATKAKVAIEAMLRDARKRIAAADKSTFQDIAQAAKRGEEAIQNVGADALIEMADAGAAERANLAKRAAKDEAALDSKATKAEAAMVKDAASVNGNVDQQWLDDAVKEANAKLDDNGVFNVVTDGEAKRALNVLTSLPPELQGKAVEKLGDEQFANLLDEVPAARREDFETLVKQTTDPDRKLALWGEFHKSRANNEVERHKGDTGDDKWFWESKTDDEKEATRRHEARKNAADHTAGEIDEEIAFLKEQAKNGTPITAAQVDKLMERKTTELDMEMKYNLNITNEKGARKDGTKIVWTKEELDALEGSFGQLPEDHLAGNKLLKELRREDVDTDADGTENPSVGGTHSNGVITVTDWGARTSGNGFRHGGDAREMASPYICGRCGTKITVLDMVVTHEIGHDIHDQQGDNFKKFQQISGWESMSKDKLKAAGLTDAEIKQLQDNRNSSFADRDSKMIHKDGKLYMVDPYSGGFLVVDDTAIPAAGEAEAGANGTNSDTWKYARSNYKDHFAEMYAKAVHVPEKLHKDLVERPAQATHDAEQKVRDAEADLAAAGGDPGMKAAAQQQLDEAKAQLERTKKAESQRKQQFDLMRNDVFDTDTAESSAKARLVEKGVSPEKIKEFEERAAKASTPDQIKTIEAEF